MICFNMRERDGERERERERERGLFKELKDFEFALEILHKFSHFLFFYFMRGLTFCPPP